MRGVLWAIVVGVMGSACGAPPPSIDAGPHDSGIHYGPPTGALCPTTNPPTYSGFGQAFFATYCTRCHASTLVGDAARNGAPDGFDYDTLAGVRAHIREIDEAAAIGPSASNRIMPLSAPRPTDAERTTLGQLLACGVPE
jgi:hypothetical protein